MAQESGHALERAVPKAAAGSPPCRSARPCWRQALVRGATPLETRSKGSPQRARDGAGGVGNRRGSCTSALHKLLPRNRARVPVEIEIRPWEGAEGAEPFLSELLPRGVVELAKEKRETRLARYATARTRETVGGGKDEPLARKNPWKDSTLASGRDRRVKK